MPRRALALLLILTVGGALAARPDDPPARPGDLDATLRKLEKEIEAVRGLAFKKPVVARVIPRPKDATPGLQGYYSPTDKALTVYDDLKGSYERGVLVHEMVHALQDQHFGLAKLHQPEFGSDAELARAALIEGDASLTMIEVLQKEQPKAGMMLQVPLEKARNLRNAFLYGQGARWVKAIKDKGGWKAVDARYRFPPVSTAAILHPGEFIQPVNLGPGPARGEYGLIELLQANPATAAESVQAAAGWRGDRTVKDKAGSAWTVAFATRDQAARFHGALARLRTAQAEDRKPTGTPADGLLWKSPTQARQLLLRDRRVVELTAGDEAGLEALRERLDGPPTLVAWSAREKKELTLGELTDRLMAARIVCVGETHDSEAHHAAQLLLIRALAARDDRLGVGLEMFQRPFQKHLDRYVAGSVSEETMLEDTEYRQRWGFEWSLYRPILDFCRRNSLPVAGLNLPRELQRRISEVGYEKLTAEEKKQVGDVDFQVKAHRAHWYDRLAGMHGEAKTSDDRKERTYQVMTAWDEFMAASAAAFLKERKLGRVVVLAGSGHIDHKFGIPDRAARRAGVPVLTVHVTTDADLTKLQADPPADFILAVR